MSVLFGEGGEEGVSRGQNQTEEGRVIYGILGYLLTMERTWKKRGRAGVEEYLKRSSDFGHTQKSL